MPTTTGSAPPGPASVRFAQRPDRNLFAGLSAPRAVALGLCILAVGAALTLAGPTAGLIAAVGVSPLAGAALLMLEGRALIEWAPVAAHYVWRGCCGQLLFLAQIMSARPRPAGTLPLPGDVTRLRVLQSQDGSAIIHDPYTDCFTAVAAVHGEAFLTADPGDQDAVTAGWGRALAGIAADGQIRRIQILHTTRPDTGATLKATATQGISQSCSETATVAYLELLDQTGPWWRHDTLLAITLTGKAAHAAIRRAAHHTGNIRGADRVLTAHRDAIPDTLAGADVTVDTWLTPADLTRWIRAAYDPASTPLRDTHPDTTPDTATAGPVAVQETWAHLHTDTAWHTTLWISQWPRAETHPGFLAALILPTGAATSLTLLYEPVPTGVALRQIGRDKTAQASDGALRRRLGRLDTAAQAARETDTAQREADITAGHLDMRHTGLITVTAGDPEALRDAVTRIRQAAAAAGCDTKVLYGQQMQAFHAATLPLTRGL